MYKIIFNNKTSKNSLQSYTKILSYKKLEQNITKKFRLFLQIFLKCQVFNIRTRNIERFLRQTVKLIMVILSVQAREIFKYFNCTNYVATKFNYILLSKRSWDGEIENDIKC